MSVYIGPWVLNLASLKEDGRHQHVQLGHELEELVVGQMLEGELSLAGVPWVSLTENSVTIARNNLARLQKAPHEVLHLVIGSIQSYALDHLLEEDEHLLVGEAMERPGEAAHSGAEREVGVGECGAHQVSGVGRDVTSLVVTKNMLVRNRGQDTPVVSDYLWMVRYSLISSVNMGSLCPIISVKL